MEDEERRALSKVTRDFLSGVVDHTSTATVLASAAQFSRDEWGAMAGLGLQGVAVPEELGGTALGQSASLLVHKEIARALYAGPFLGTVGQVAPGLLALGELDTARRRLGLIAAGELTAAAAVPLGGSPDSAFPDSGLAVTAVATADGWQLDGVLPCVLDAELADGLLVAADSPDGPALLWAEAGAPGLAVQPLATVDLTRRIARVSLSAAPAELIAGPACGPQSAERAREAVRAIRTGTVLALVAECVGIAERALEITVTYVKSRRQFGRPVGSFQAVKHRCAELLVRLEMARSALQLAGTPATSAAESAARLTAAGICAGEAAFTIANEAIHLHGGIGFTWDYPLHLYYRRAKSNQQLLGSADGQRIHLAAAVAAMYAEQEDVS